MLEKLAKRRKLIAIIWGVILIASFLLEIIFGNADDRITIIVATVIGLPLIYFGVILMFKVVRVKAPLKFIRFGSWFFLICSLIGIVLSIPNYIRDFPNGFSPLISCCMGMWLGILTDIKKHIDGK